MQTTYEGYFDNGCFYVSGKAMPIPEQRNIFITIPEERQSVDSDKQKAWNDFKRMVKDTAHENDLLTNDIFVRRRSGRELIDFAVGADAL
ncbi:MAG: hypothetical protein LBI36_04660 [Oscillospiraceae bacterium]|jgi:hypothetical protein|nr:hypothetical protein [Oscillospiraceae bacterium]